MLGPATSFRRVRVAAGAIAVAAAAATGSDREPPSTHWPRSAIAVLDPADNAGPVTGAWGDGWINDRWQGTLLRLDGATGRVVAEVPVGGRVALGSGGAAVWALKSGGGYGRALNGPLLRIDPRTSRVAARIRLRTPRGDPVVGFGVLAAGAAVWIWGPRQLLQLDGRRARVRRAVVIPERHGELTGAAIDGGSLVATTADGHLMRYDARTGAHRGRWRLPLGEPVVRGATGGRIYLTDGEWLVALDAPDAAPAWRRRLGFRIGSVVERDGFLWIQGARTVDPGDRVWALDARSGAVRASTVLPAFGTNGMAALGDRLWVSASSGRMLVLRAWLPSWLRAV